MGLLSLLLSSSLILGVRPQIAQAPTGVWITIRIEPHQDNRTLSVNLESDQFSTGSLWTLNGTAAPRFHQRQFLDLPAGDYEVSVVLRDGAGHIRASAQSTFSRL